jgi:hypothetical protein
MNFRNAIDSAARVQRRRDARELAGVCLCGTPVAWHHDDQNRFLPCDHPDVVAARLRIMLSKTLRIVRGGRP